MLQVYSISPVTIDCKYNIDLYSKKNVREVHKSKFKHSEGILGYIAFNIGLYEHGIRRESDHYSNAHGQLTAQVLINEI